MKYPGLGIEAQQNFVEFQVLESAQGIAVIPLFDNVFLQPEIAGAQVVSESGLILSNDLEKQNRNLLAGVFPKVEGITYRYLTWQRVGPEKYVSEMQYLYNMLPLATDEMKNDIRKSLALFFFAHGLHVESQGVLDYLFEKSAPYFLDNNLSMISGVNLLMMGRLAEAKVLLMKPKFDDNIEIGLFRGLMYAKLGDWDKVITYLNSAQKHIVYFPAKLRVKFRLAFIEANLNIRNIETVYLIIEDILAEDVPEKYFDYAKYFAAEADVLNEQYKKALDILERLKLSKDRFISAKAGLLEARTLFAMGEIGEEKLLELLSQMRFSWRGDDFEFNLLEDIAKYSYLNGDYRGALFTMRQAVGDFSGHSRVGKLTNQMKSIFVELYLDGVADELDPVVALALYNDYRELTPIGEEGDLMIRYLADRLVQVDLLDQAAELLKHQIKYRLDDKRRAEVARQLAVIYLIGRQPLEAPACYSVHRV